MQLGRIHYFGERNISIQNHVYVLDESDQLMDMYDGVNFVSNTQDLGLERFIITRNFQQLI